MVLWMRLDNQSFVEGLEQLGIRKAIYLDMGDGVTFGIEITRVRDIQGMSIEEFMHLQEQCQAAAASLALFDAMAV